jgi:hypothetical protein
MPKEIVTNLTPEERRAIKGAVRRAFRQSPRMRDVLQGARVELPPALKKDGTPGARNQVRYRCATCKELYPQKFCQVDHRDPAVPLGVKEEDMTPTELVNGVFCLQENLQVLCSTPLRFLPKGKKSCHAIKTAEENFIRKNLLEKGQTIEFWKSKYVEYLAIKEKERSEKEKRKLEKQAKKAQR